MDKGALALCHGTACRRPAYARDEPWESRFLELDDTHRRPTAGLRGTALHFPRPSLVKQRWADAKTPRLHRCRRGECPRAL